MSRMLAVLLCVACSLLACGSDDDKVKIVLFQAAPDTIEPGQSTKLVFAVEPADARVTINGLGDLTGKTEAAVSPTTTTSYQLTATNGSATTGQTVKVTVGAAAISAVRIEVATATPTAGDPLPVTLTILGKDGKTATGFHGALGLSSSDGHAVLPGDLAFADADAGVKTATVMLKTAGTATLTATDKSGAIAAPAFTSVVVRPGPAGAYQLSKLPGAATAGDALVLTITAVDGFGNVATAYDGKVRVVSTDASDVLPPGGGFVAGVASLGLAFTRVGDHVAQVQDTAAMIPSATTSSVAIGAARAASFTATTASASATAGEPQTLTATALDRFGNIATGYTGTVQFTASDAQAALPGDFAFSAGDAGHHDFAVTLKTAGAETVTLTDKEVGAVTGSATWTVGAAAAATCVAGQAGDTASAGTVLGLLVAVRDAFGNTATGYTGTIAVTASDARANLPAAATYGPTDAGRHAFPVALVTAGSQTVTATDVGNAAIQCSAAVAITPGAPRLVLTVPPDANAGFPVSVAVAVKDVFDNPIPAYTGTVTFTSTDTGTGAVTPGPLTFATSDGGHATTSATFVTLGPQTLAASDGGTPQATGSKAATVHGLIYTQPTTGRVRLVANPASNAQVVQLDLVAGERLEVSAFFGGPGSFSAGMNLPLDTTRVAAGSPLFVRGAALPPGPGVPAQVAAIGADHVLYTGVSRKRVTGTAVATQDTDVPAGQVFYSVRLALQATSSVGPVFDGAQPMAMFRAAVRDQFGDDFVGQVDFGVGKLEVR
jgi:hypothetical protein